MDHFKWQFISIHYHVSVLNWSIYLTPLFLLKKLTWLYCIVNAIGINALQWRHNEHDGVSNNQHYDCFLNRLFRRRSKKTSKLRVAGPCEGIQRSPVNSPHKGPVTQKMFPFDDVIRTSRLWSASCTQLWVEGFKIWFIILNAQLLSEIRYPSSTYHAEMPNAIRWYDTQASQKLCSDPQFSWHVNTNAIYVQILSYYTYKEAWNLNGISM